MLDSKLALRLNLWNVSGLCLNKALAASDPSSHQYWRLVQNLRLTGNGNNLEEAGEFISKLMSMGITLDLKSMSTYKSRNFTFTWNNYPLEHQEKLFALKHNYIVYGKKVGKLGTPHLQGTIVFLTQKTEKAVRKLMPGCHIEYCADLPTSITYCKKDGSFTEWGTAPKTPQIKGMDEQERWKRIRQACEDNNTDEVDPKTRFKMYEASGHFKAIGSKKRKLDDTEAIHEWYWGEARTRKSRKAREDNPEAYLKMCNKWWDGIPGTNFRLAEHYSRCSVSTTPLKLGRRIVSPIHCLFVR